MGYKRGAVNGCSSDTTHALDGRSPSPERDHVRRKSAAAGTPRVDAVGRNPGAGDGDCLGVVRPVADVEDFLAGRPGSGLRMPASLA